MLQNYKKNLKNSKQKIIELSNDIYEAFKLSFEGFKSANIDRSNEAKKIVKNVYNQANKIDNEIIKTLALFSPEAKDLRVLIAYLKITNELLRVSEYIKTHTKTIKIQIINELDIDSFKQNIISFHQSTLKSLKAAVDSLNADEDSIENIFKEVNIQESKCDDIFSILEKNILSQISLNPKFTGEYIRFLNSLRKLERISDRSVSIVRLNYFAQKGGKIKF